MKNEKYQIMVTDDHPIIHDGLKTLLSTEKDLEISATASSADEALRKMEEWRPDIAIVDLSLGTTDGTYLIQQIKKLHPDLLVLVYTMSDEKLFAERTAAAGASGYAMKTSPPSVLKEAVRTILSGDIYFSPESKKRILYQRENGIKPRTLFGKLSNREMDVFKLVGDGLDSVNISEQLSISRNTVDTHRINIKNKLELPNGKALDRLAYEVIQQGKIPEF